jgi:dihydrolipoamide dehydrogenase
MADIQAFDIVIIGGGPAGYEAAIRAGQLGLKAAIVEMEPALGGTCLRVGCIPSKAMLDTSELYHQAAGGFGDHGIKVSGLELDVSAVRKRKDKVVKVLTGGVAGLMKKHGVQRFEGVGRLAGEGRVVVEGKDKAELNGKHILIATGSAPIELPGLKFDGERIVHSTHALDFESVPASLLVVGGGAIGLELGSVWSRFGAKVTVVELAAEIVPGADAEAAKALGKVLEKQGIEILREAKVTAAKVGKDGVEVTIDGAGGASNRKVDKVLVAVGRRVYTDGLGLDKLGIKTDERNRIVVDGHFRTNVAGVYAVGDVIAGPMLAHKAAEDGVACVEMIAGKGGHVNWDLVPGVVYTWPELAWVGKTEATLRKEGRAIRVGTFPFMASGRARAAGETDGFAKVIVDEATDEVLGIHILGARAADVIAEAALAMAYRASAEDIYRTCHAHPTFAEALKEAALDTAGASRAK